MLTYFLFYHSAKVSYIRYSFVVIQSVVVYHWHKYFRDLFRFISFLRIAVFLRIVALDWLAKGIRQPTLDDLERSLSSHFILFDGWFEFLLIGYGIQFESFYDYLHRMGIKLPLLLCCLYVLVRECVCSWSARKPILYTSWNWSDNFLHILIKFSILCVTIIFLLLACYYSDWLYSLRIGSSNSHH